MLLRYSRIHDPAEFMIPEQPEMKMLPDYGQGATQMFSQRNNLTNFQKKKRAKQKTTKSNKYLYFK